MNNLKLLMDVFRLRQWVKNLFMVAPLIFSGTFNQWYLWFLCFFAVLGFCFISGGMYIINDIIDLKEDRLHPRKALRPLAAGKVELAQARILALVSLIIGGVLCYAVSKEVFFMAALYVALHAFYNLWAKHIVILDVLTVAFGFQIRIWAGAAAIAILPSMWLQVCMFVLALFLGLTKRRGEVVCLEQDAYSHRPVLTYYSTYLLDQLIVLCAALSIVLYGLYTISLEMMGHVRGYLMFYSIGFVVYGIFRYMYLLHIKKTGDDPSEALLSDPPMIINIVLWISFIMFVLQHSYAS